MQAILQREVAEIAQPQVYLFQEQGSRVVLCTHLIHLLVPQLQSADHVNHVTTELEDLPFVLELPFGLQHPLVLLDQRLRERVLDVAPKVVLGQLRHQLVLR